MSVWSITLLFFFFKQKTAYEMRISDWSSDVCSSDLFSPRRRTISAVELDMRGSFASRPARRLSLERRIAGRPSSPCRDEHQMFVVRPADSRLGQKKGKSSTLQNFPEGSSGTGPIRLPRRRWLDRKSTRLNSSH